MAPDVVPCFQEIRDKMAAIDGRIQHNRGVIRKLDEDLDRSIALIASRCNPPQTVETQQENVGAR